MKLPECKYDNTIMELAVVEKSPDIMVDDHGFLLINVTFDYGGSFQGLGRIVDGEFIKKFIQLWNVECLSNCRGYIFVERIKNDIIVRLINIKTKKELDFNANT